MVIVEIEKTIMKGGLDRFRSCYDPGSDPQDTSKLAPGDLIRVAHFRHHVDYSGEKLDGKGPGRVYEIVGARINETGGLAPVLSRVDSPTIVPGVPTIVPDNEIDWDNAIWEYAGTKRHRGYWYFTSIDETPVKMTF
ncbi:hypothetical protein ACFLQN_01340 [Candidatus Aenigmatarchaeota archaeon]